LRRKTTATTRKGVAIDGKGTGREKRQRCNYDLFHQPVWPKKKEKKKKCPRRRDGPGPRFESRERGR